MFNKVFRKPNERPPRPEWVKWLLIGFVFYLVVSGTWRSDDPAERTPLQMAIDQTGEDLKKQTTIDLSSYKNRIFPQYNAASKVKDTKTGSGPVAMCGQEVTLRYSAYKPDGKQVEDFTTKDKPLTFALGSGNVMPVLQEAVPGMYAGGSRSITVPLSMSYGLKDYQRTELVSGDDIRFEIDLLSVKPELSRETLKPYRIVDIKEGYGDPVTCGKPVRVNLLIWDLSGKEIYSSVTKLPAEEKTESNGQSATPAKIQGSLEFTPGKQEVFFGLEQGVIGMHGGAVRTLIVPPTLQKTLYGKPAAINFPFPQNQTVLVDVEYLP